MLDCRTRNTLSASPEDTTVSLWLGYRRGIMKFRVALRLPFSKGKEQGESVREERSHLITLGEPKVIRIEK